MDLPLTGIRILDLAPGPLAPTARFLSELGAEVIRVEPRGGASDRHAGATVAGATVAGAS